MLLTQTKTVIWHESLNIFAFDHLGEGHVEVTGPYDPSIEPEDYIHVFAEGVHYRVRVQEVQDRRGLDYKTTTVTGFALEQ